VGHERTGFLNIHPVNNESHSIFEKIEWLFTKNRFFLDT